MASFIRRTQFQIRTSRAEKMYQKNLYQVQILKEHLEELQMQYDTARETNNRTSCHSIHLRMVTVSRMLDDYVRYAVKMKKELKALRQMNENA